MTDQPEHHLRPIGDSLGQEADALIHPEEAVEVPPPEQMSLIRRVRQPKTILSIAVPLVIIVVAILLNRDKLAEVPRDVSKANLWLVALAFVVYYLGFPLRGHRWTVLLRGAGYRISTKDGTEILFLSWLVNCVVPAKLGDVYRAYLLKLNSPVSLTKTLGTVFIERILDLFAIAILGLAAGYIHFRNGLPGDVQVIFAFGVALVVVLALALIGMRNFGRRLVEALPLPHRAEELYDRFEEGVFQSVGLRGLPWLGVLTGIIWLTEGFRLFFVIQAFGFADVHLGISGTLFVALCGSLLTAVPLTPGGLGFVEAGGIGLLYTVFGIPFPEASAIVLIDRVISVFSIVVLGSVAYVISSKPRGSGIRVEEITRAPNSAG
jgi:uncharacterized protein (TIRG00374 family)